MMTSPLRFVQTSTRSNVALLQVFLGFFWKTFVRSENFLCHNWQLFMSKLTTFQWKMDKVRWLFYSFIDSYYFLFCLNDRQLKDSTIVWWTSNLFCLLFSVEVSSLQRLVWEWSRKMGRQLLRTLQEQAIFGEWWIIIYNH